MFGPATPTRGLGLLEEFQRNILIRLRAGQIRIKARKEAERDWVFLSGGKFPYRTRNLIFRLRCCRFGVECSELGQSSSETIS